MHRIFCMYIETLKTSNSNIHCNFSSRLPLEVTDNAMINSSNSILPSYVLKKEDIIWPNLHIRFLISWPNLRNFCINMCLH